MTATLLLLPGLACDDELFRDQVGPLRADGHAVRVADAHTRHATLPAMADALLAEHPGPLALAGCSMGGMLAMELWRQAPDRVTRLALLGTSARADTPELIRLRSDAIGLFEQGRLDEVLLANLMFAFHPDHAADRRLTDAYRAMVQRAGAAQLIAQNRAVMAREDLRPMLPGVRCPTLVMVGEEDRLTPPEHAEEIAAAIPGAALHRLPRCGHMLSWEQPAAVTDALRAWAAGRLPVRPG